MHIIKLDPSNGSLYIDSVPVQVLQTGILIGTIANVCRPPVRTTQGGTRYHLTRKIGFGGQSANGVIEVNDGGAFSVTLVFDSIEFFDSSILESKIVKAFEKSCSLKFISNHPGTAFLDACKWGSAIFFHDAKQGDLSLEIRFGRCISGQGT